MIAALAEAALRTFVLGSVVWFGLILFRVRNPHVHMTAWLVVLAASLAMPFLMHWPTLSIVRVPVPIPATEEFWPADVAVQEIWQPAPSSLPGPVAAPPARSAAVMPWGPIATIVYASVAGLMLLRLALGLFLTWRLVRAAPPLRESAMTGVDVRVSRGVGGPVTFGATILVPPQFVRWDARKRLAVLAHERAHVANRDFHVLLVASLNRAVFWFSPFAWWQLARLAELAEIISDAQAIEAIEDRLSYAEILLDVATGARTRPLELAMARASTVRARVERIIAAAALPASVGWRKRLSVAAMTVPAVIVSAGLVAYRAPEAVVAVDYGRDAAGQQHYRSFVNFYALGPGAVFAIFRDGDELSGQMTGQRKQRLTVTADGRASYAASLGEISFSLDDERRSSELMLRVNGRDVRAVRVAEMPPPAGDAVALDSYAGWYKLGQHRVLAVRREGNRLQVQETGQARVTLLAEGADSFSGRGDDLLVFLRDEQGKVNRVLLQLPTWGPHLATRIDAATASTIEAEFARRIAEVPDHFRDQVPLPGSKEMILLGIEDMRRGTPQYDRMSAALGAKIHQQLDELHATFVALGAVESIFFRGVGPGGYDIYGVKFENGTAEFRLLMEPDGKAADVLFRPDGNGEPGDVVSCAQEAAVRGSAGTSPIKILLFNDTADDIQVFNLAADGSRRAQSVIKSNTSGGFLTTVNNPWVVADRSGACLEIVVPGQRTRFHTVDASSSGGPKLAMQRTVPVAAGEEMLRHYIETLGRGEPDYERMTSEVAEQTRRQLPFDQAILARLGTLRAMSFRGVSALGSDIYIAQFANGSAEWRIGVKNGTITRIALGPSY